MFSLNECGSGMNSSKRGIEANQEFVSDFINLKFVFDRFKLANNSEHLVGKLNNADSGIMR